MAYVDVTFDGVHADVTGGDAEFNLSIGPDPSTGVLRLAGVGHTMATGDLVITDGTTTVTLPNLDVEERTEHEGADGTYTRLKIRDRRWKWGPRAHVTGEWNTPAADGHTIDAAVKKSSRELVALCLDAMGETGYDVSALPDDYYPYVQWEFAPAVQAAQEVCDQCRATLNLASDDTAEVVLLGSGSALPATTVEDEDTGVRYVGKPDKYLVRGARKMIQRISTLTPVGLDTDGSIKPVADLSYYDTARAGYVGGSIWRARANKFGTLETTNPTAWKAANESIGLWYRLPDAVLKYLPVLGSICETATDDTGDIRWKPPRLETDTLYYIKADDSNVFRPQVSGEFSEAWEMDAETGIVKLETPPVPNNDDDTAAPVSLKLTWAHESRQSDGTLTDDDFYTYADGSGTSERVENAEWLVMRGVVAEGATDPTWQNKSELDLVAAKLVDLIADAADTETSGEATYTGIRDIYPDGAIRQVTWQVGQQGGTTRLTRNSDRPPLGRARLGARLDQLRTEANARSGAAADRYRALAGRARPRTNPPAPGRRFRSPRNLIAENAAGEDAPFGALVRIKRDPGDDNVTEFEKPEHGGISNIGILDGYTPGGVNGSLVVAGECFVNVEYGDYYQYYHFKPGQRIGASPGSWAARIDDGGPLEVLEKIEDGDTLVRCAFIRRRLQCLILRVEEDGEDPVVRAAGTVVWGEGYTLTQGRNEENTATISLTGDIPTGSSRTIVEIPPTHHVWAATGDTYRLTRLVFNEDIPVTETDAGLKLHAGTPTPGDTTINANTLVWAGDADSLMTDHGDNVIEVVPAGSGSATGTGQGSGQGSNPGTSQGSGSGSGSGSGQGTGTGQGSAPGSGQGSGQGSGSGGGQGTDQGSAPGSGQGSGQGSGLGSGSGSGQGTGQGSAPGSGQGSGQGSGSGSGQGTGQGGTGGGTGSGQGSGQGSGTGTGAGSGTGSAGGSGSGVANDCNDCDPPLQDTYYVTICDLIGDCEDLNGTYAVTWTSGCSWVSSGGLVVLTWSGDAWQVYTDDPLFCLDQTLTMNDPCDPTGTDAGVTISETAP